MPLFKPPPVWTPQTLNIGKPRRPTFYEAEEVAYSQIPLQARQLIAERLRMSDLRARDRARPKRRRPDDS